MSRPKNAKDLTKRKSRATIKSDMLIGKTIGRWTVIEKIQNDRQVRFKVVCACGTEKIRTYVTLAYGKSNSCGCLHKEQLTKRQIKPNNFSAFLKLFNTYKINANKRNIQFNLSFEQIKEISQKNCFYCEKKPSNSIKTSGGTIFYSGIDRVNNEVGYTCNNIVPCCKTCNNAKHSITKEIIYKLYHLLFTENQNV